MATKYKKLRRAGKVYIVSSTDGGKTWSKPKLFNSKEHRQEVEKSKFSPKYHKEMEERRKRDEEKRNNKNKNRNTIKAKKYTPLEDDNDAADRKEERVFRSSSSVEKAKEKHAKNTPRLEDDNDAADRREEKIFRSSSSVEKAKDKHDPLRKYRRGPGTGRKDTRITKHLKKSGFTEDRLAAKRKAHAEWKAARKNRKTLKKNTGG